MMRQSVSKFMNKRDFLRVAVGLPLSAYPMLSTSAIDSSQRLETTANRQGLLLSASDNRQGEHFVSWQTLSATNKYQLPIAWRGHGLAQHPQYKNQVVMFARRPGTVCYVFDGQTQAIQQSFKSQAGHHFCGHGCFSQEGRYLFTSEMDYQTGRGKIGIRDTQDYRYLGAYETQGTDPHDVRLLNDGKTLVVANGGILTHPNSGRKKLNLATMQSSLVLLDAFSGEVREQFTTPWQHASLRHLSVGQNDTVSVAIQYQREAVAHDDLLPLSALLKKGADRITFNQADDVLWAQLDDYMGSTAMNDRYGLAGFTSPRGNLAAFWRLDGTFAAYHRMRDVCGLAITLDQRYFVLSSSTGELRYIDAKNLQEARELRQTFPQTQWDNHLLII